MLRPLILIVILAAASASASASADVRPTSSPRAWPGIATATARVGTVARAAGMSGEIVLTDVDGTVSDTVIGDADREARAPHARGQRWLWASVTKQVAATLVMQEVDRGTLALDDPLGKLLPWFEGDRTITLRDLLQHRSGLPNPSHGAEGEDPPAFYRETGAGISDSARAHGFCAGPAERERGAGFEYNNCDYLVIGAVLEQVTGTSLGRLVDERIARPLGLRTIEMAPDGAVAGGSAVVGYDGGRRASALNVATFGAAGALTGSAAELAAIDRALMDGRLLSDRARAVAWKGDPKLGYEALGVWAFPARLAGCSAPVDLIERRGDIGGIQVRNVIAPRLGRAVVVFVNSADTDFGEVWQGKGLTHDLLAAAFCETSMP